MNRHSLRHIVIVLIAISCGAPILSSQEHEWCRGKIDEFVRSRHIEAHVSPSPEANRRTLIRRLSFDLLGLPPSPEEVDAFVADASPDAYERLVDRLLASPRFGERLAQFWLDLARYADSDGYHDDTNRSMWPYRDWVIEAFNKNKPFDQFTIEQLAGDQLPSATIEQQIATAFHRNGPTSSEDGANPEEYRARYAVDRVNTTATVWLGMTVQCAECHDHKYDPISIREYYQLFAFFNQTPEEPLFRGLYAPPSIAVPDREQANNLESIADRLKQNERHVLELSEDLDEPLRRWRRELVAQSLSERDPVSNEFLFRGTGPPQLDNTGTRRRAAAFRSSATGTTPKSTAGLLDEALNFAGDGAAVDLDQLVEFRRSLAFTAELWFQYTHVGGPLISKIDVANKSRGFDVRIVDGRAVVRFIDQWPEAAIQVSTTTKFPPNQWLHLSVTYEGSATAGGIHIYLNGEPQDLTVDVDGELHTIRNGASLLVGGGPKENRSLHGSIDEIAFYKWPLTSVQLQDAPFRKLQKIARTASPTEVTEQFVDAFFRGYFRDYLYPPTTGLRKEIVKLKHEQQQLLQQVPRVRVMSDDADRRRTYVLQRGDFRDPAEEVQPDTPRMFPPLTKKTKQSTEYSRLDLARWIVGPNRAHTARVAANRIWALLFDRGIVSTLDDFGSRGEPPSHPKLLDWLASRFLNSQWDIKALVRQFVNSSTYRQCSSGSAAAWRHDPNNELLARGPRHRLSAEALRDNVLKVSGLLQNRIGGPSVRPYQPSGLWREMSKGDDAEKSYQQSHGEDLYRRGIYTFWKRSIHYPTFAVFDAPNREVCTSSRPSTNTPIQALALLNDITFVEAARTFAVAIMRESHDFDGRIQFAYRRALARPATASEATVFREMHSDLRSSYERNPATAKDLSSLQVPTETAEFDPIELAAWTAVAQVVLTLDETITKQ